MKEKGLFCISLDEGFLSVIAISASNTPLFCKYGDSPVTVKLGSGTIIGLVNSWYLFTFPTNVVNLGVNYCGNTIYL